MLTLHCYHIGLWIEGGGYINVLFTFQLSKENLICAEFVVDLMPKHAQLLIVTLSSIFYPLVCESYPFFNLFNYNFNAPFSSVASKHHGDKTTSVCLRGLWMTMNLAKVWDFRTAAFKSHHMSRLSNVWNDHKFDMMTW